MVYVLCKTFPFLKMLPYLWAANKYQQWQLPETAFDPALCGHLLTLVGKQFVLTLKSI